MKRTFWLLLHILLLLIYHVSFPCAQYESEVDHEEDEEKKSHPFTVEKVKVSPNATGLQLGFWPNFNSHQIVLEHFDKRTIGRGTFSSWAKYENASTGKGNYDFKEAFRVLKRHHRFGEAAIHSLNISFSPEIQTKNAFPPFYDPRITDPTTRKAAKDFLYAYVQELIKNVGQTYLSIDYEIVFNYRLYFNSGNDQDSALSRQYANEWSAWYVEAAAVARQAASDLGKPEQLKLIPIVNGNPFKEGTILSGGRTNNQWLIDVMGVSDVLGIDTYHWMNDTEITDPYSTIAIIQHWIDNYADGKPVILVENGFSAAKSIDPNATNRKKYIGTEEQQAIYFRRLFEEIMIENREGGKFDNQLRGFLFWTITDNSFREEPYERYFGLLTAGPSNIPKPAYYAVKEGFEAIESDPFHQPFRATDRVDVTELLADNQETVEVDFVSGNEFESITCTFDKLEKSDSYHLSIRVENPGTLLVNINEGSKWLHLTDDLGTVFNLDITPYLFPGKENKLKLYFTGDTFPFQQQVKSIHLFSDK